MQFSYNYMILYTTLYGLTLIYKFIEILPEVFFLFYVLGNFIYSLIYNIEIREIMQKEKTEKILELGFFTELDTLSKLRLIIISIFILSTLAIILILLIPVVSGILFIISYIIILVLMIKLLMTKKL